VPHTTLLAVKVVAVELPEKALEDPPQSMEPSQVALAERFPAATLWAVLVITVFLITFLDHSIPTPAEAEAVVITIFYQMSQALVGAMVEEQDVAILLTQDRSMPPMEQQVLAVAVAVAVPVVPVASSVVKVGLV
jgi:hypothetical protein